MTVAVLGNGPVGQTTALLLARWGVPVLLLDARPARDPVGSKAICQQRDVLDVWAALGVGEQLAREGVTWTTARTFHRDRELFAHTLPDPGRSPFPPFVNISQARTEELLDKRIAEQALIQVRWDHRVTGLDQDADGVHLTCATADGPVRLHADYAVACTGAGSGAVRELLGVGFAGHSFDDRFLICDIRAELPWARERRFYFDPAWNPGRQVLIHPCPDRTFRIDWQVPADFDLTAEQATGALDRRIRQIIGEVPYEIVWQSVYRFHARVADRMRVGRVLLAGDCAHLVAPFGARGLNSGVADAENAAWKLAYVWHGWAQERLLESYHRERHAAALENLEVTTATMDFLVPGTESARLRRAEILAAGLVDQVDSGRLAEPFWYPGSPLNTPDPTRPAPARPPRGTALAAAPGVLVPDVPLPDGSRLREHTRDGFLVLAEEDAAVPAGRGPLRALRLAAEEVAVPACCGPVRVLGLAEEPRRALGARPGEVWVVRPDAHIAAVLDRPGAGRLAAALRRA
ncbi:FAD-dependent monooxygenase, partial [Crossiella equi]